LIVDVPHARNAISDEPGSTLLFAGSHRTLQSHFPFGDADLDLRRIDVRIVRERLADICVYTVIGTSIV
jgi:hypothetical protein